LGGADGTGAQDDVLTIDGEGLTTAINGYPHSPVAIEPDAVDHTAWPDRQVEAVPTLAQVAQGGTEADAVVVVGDGRTYT
jgi:hypothetical protein